MKKPATVAGFNKIKADRTVLKTVLFRKNNFTFLYLS